MGMRLKFQVATIIFTVLALTVGYPFQSHAEEEDASLFAAPSNETAEADLFTGTMSYTIPIEIPPGRKGLQPDVSLRYRSGNGVGWFGVGWDIKVGFIQRNFKGQVDWNSYDRFQINRDGSLSDLSSYDNNYSGGGYRQKFEGRFDHIQFFYLTSTIIGWQLTDKNGIKYTFGKQESARLFENEVPSRVLKWYVERVEDPNGNYITYEYDKDTATNEITLREITYNNNDKNMALTVNRIKFHSEPSNHLNISYPSGFSTQTSRRIKTIEVKAGDQPVRAYKLTYRQNDVYNDPPVLTGVQEFGNDYQINDGNVTGPTTKPAITLEYPPWLSAFSDQNDSRKLGNGALVNTQLPNYRYGNFTGGVTSDGLWIQTDGTLRVDTNLVVEDYSSAPTDWGRMGVGSQPERYKTADVNGDGKDDVVFVATDGNIYVGLSNGSRFESPTAEPIDWDNNKVAIKWLYNIKDSSPGRYFFADVTGDSKADLIYVEYGGFVHVGRSTGKSFEPLSRWDKDRLGEGELGGRYHIIDVNGDGKADIAYIKASTTSSSCLSSINVAKSTGTGFDYTGYWTGMLGSDGEGCDPANYVFQDFNADGRTDIMFIASAHGGLHYIGLSNGKDRFLIKNEEHWLPPDYSKGRYFYADFNGDAKPDAVKIDTSGDVTLYVGNGRTFTEATDIPSFQLGDGTLARYKLAIFAGRFGLIFIDSTGYQRIKYHEPQPVNYLTSVSNGYGGKVEVKYGFSEDYTESHLPFPVYVVTKINKTAGNTSHSHASTYRYRGAFYHKAQQEFRGFNIVTETQLESDAIDEPVKVKDTYFHQGDDLGPSNTPDVEVAFMKGKPYRIVERDSHQNIYSDTEILYTEGSHYNYDGKLMYYFNPPSQVDVYRCAGVYDCRNSSSAFHTMVQYDYTGENVASLGDLYGLRGLYQSGIVYKEYHYGDVSDPSDDFTKKRWYSPNAQKWIVALPAKEETYQGITTTSPKASTSYYYDGTGECSVGSGQQSPTKGNLTRIFRWYDKNPSASPETWMGYDDYGNLECVKNKDAKGKPTSYEYDDASEVLPTEVKDPRGEITKTDYSLVVTSGEFYGKPKTVTQPNGLVTTMTYDPLGRPTSRTENDDTQTTSDYPTLSDPINLAGMVGNQHVTQRTWLRKNGIWTDEQWSETYFDGFGRTVKTRTSSPAYNAFPTVIVTESEYATYTPQVVKQYHPYFEGNTRYASTSFEYDLLNRPTFQRREDGSTAGAATKTCYGSNFYVTVDENGNRTRYTNDAYGRLKKVETYTGTFTSCTTDEESSKLYSTTEYAYDVLGNLTNVSRYVKDETTATTKKVETIIQYDSLGRKISMTDPDMGTWTYDQYDGNGNLLLQTDARQQRIQYEYDELNRVKLKTYLCSSGVNCNSVAQVSFQYDTYDTADNVSASIAKFAKGNLTKVVRTPLATAPADLRDTVTTKYFYDDLRSVRKVLSGSGTAGTYSFQTKKNADGLGRVTSITYPADNFTVNYSYDPRGGNLMEVTGSDGTTYVKYSDFTPMLQPKLATFGNGMTTAYDYNPYNYRLSYIKTPGTGSNIGSIANFDYLYDKKGNIRSVADNQPSPLNFTQQSYSPFPGKAQAYGPDGSWFDANGNMTTNGNWVIDFDYENMPESISKSNDMIYLTYDGAGNRVKKVSLGETKLYVDKLYECKTLASGSACFKFIFAGNTRIAEKTQADIVYYYHTDHLGSTVAVTGNRDLEEKQELAYYPFGETRENRYAPQLVHFRYTGQELDKESELYNYGARLYDPQLGRFVSPDTVVPDYANPQSINRYAYALNNPLMFVDPTGHFATFVHWGIEFTASLAAGNGFSKSREYASRNKSVDAYQRESRFEANLHGMKGRNLDDFSWQSSQQFTDSINFLKSLSNTPEGHHLLQDLRAGEHNGKSMESYGLLNDVSNTLWHWVRDVAIKPSELISAWVDTYNSYLDNNFYASGSNGIFACYSYESMNSSNTSQQMSFDYFSSSTRSSYNTFDFYNDSYDSYYYSEDFVGPPSPF